MTKLILKNAAIPGSDTPSSQLHQIEVENGLIASVTKIDTAKIRDRSIETIDCGGRSVLPGLIDAHCHLRATAASLVNLDLSACGSICTITDVISEIHSFARKQEPGTWIRIKGYHEFDLAEKRHLTCLDLDKAASRNPVKLTHRTGHAHILNSLALKKIGIMSSTPDPSGGVIDRDAETGAPTGLLFEMGDYLRKRIPPIEPQMLMQGIKLANEKLLSMGITSIQDATHYNGSGQWHRFREWKESGLLVPRVSMLVGSGVLESNENRDELKSPDDAQLSLGGVKIILDETTGRLSPAQPNLNKLVFDIHEAGRQAVIHAIESHAIESACLAIELALQKLPRADHRHRIEHCSVCPPALAKRIAASGISVVTQPGFVYYNGDRYLQTVPAEQQNYLYPIKTLLNSGIRVAAGSDSPVAPADPLAGIYAAVSRKTIAGRNLLYSEKIKPLQAIDLYTRQAATALFQEKYKGSIAPGMLADLVVLNADPTRLSPEEIKDVRVDMTIVDGCVVWEKH